MPRPARKLSGEVSQPSSTRNNESAPPHDRCTRASRQNAAKNSNTPASRTPTDGRTSDGGRTAQRTAPDPVLTAGRLAKLCSECECYLRREEVEANEREATSSARRGRCDDCYRKSPAPIAPIGGPSPFRTGTMSRKCTKGPLSGRWARGICDNNHRIVLYEHLK